MVNPSPLLSTLDAFLFHNASLISLVGTQLSPQRSLSQAPRHHHSLDNMLGRLLMTFPPGIHTISETDIELSSVMYPPAPSYPRLTRAYPAHAPLSAMLYLSQHPFNSPADRPVCIANIRPSNSPLLNAPKFVPATSLSQPSGMASQPQVLDVHPPLLRLRPSQAFLNQSEAV